MARGRVAADEVERRIAGESSGVRRGSSAARKRPRPGPRARDPGLIVGTAKPQAFRRRRELGLTQKQLAGRVGIHQSEISDIERGAASPGYRTLAKLADGLDAEFKLVPRAARGASSSKAGKSVRRAKRVPAYARTVSVKRRG